MSLSCLNTFFKIERGIFLNEIKEIIKHHQEKRDLSRLAYQSAWQFLIYRLSLDKFFEDVNFVELHFPREVARELEELSKFLNLKKNEREKIGNETKEEIVLYRWLRISEVYFRRCRLWNEEFVGFVSSIVHMFLASRNHCEEIHYQCIISLYASTGNKAVKVEDLLKGKAIDAVLEEIHRPTLNDRITNGCLRFFMNISRRLKEDDYDDNNNNDDDEKEDEREKIKKEIFEKLEEEGYEDAVPSFHELIDILNRYYYPFLSLDILDYFVNA
ncbi:uncharacterized protein MONOS_15135 [Monocercomonoides exilis]|uniref:uncharacterized protein n=1 Tax=Monocercomonoides exilis TaxID=2049356 RepID=UPI00355A81DC|nr:hypothetical protein MONOS_15135 [Monocercomonoides exilis]|eukprot:MONOS_15135.1-p1 / transcript=MONOS_15135.1 / gene=MONOS_15135 / organism=Monocercomonoides_exilis_PA203 / gene_product=unspecified product / transcript_product=unspecified product / location=Mono_scaffold01152:15199-16079(+) / protein_length=272 / sequence_SO=supercontig / SO=protein_coding / is_pseudo=false